MGVPENALSGEDDALAHGVSHVLARERSAAISGVSYALRFRLPDAPGEPVEGTVEIGVNLHAPARIVLDLAEPATVHAVAVGGRTAVFTRVRNHVVVDAADTAAGRNTLAIRFTASRAALHLRSGFVYTLFVPARAHTLFPCFDQPDLKARVSLDLDVPEDWLAVANGETSAVTGAGEPGRRVHRFRETPPISTYLIAFAAGRLRVEQAGAGRWLFRVFHTCDDHARLARNLQAVADLHAGALDWLEAYTGLAYPFGTFDLLLVPAFQFGGMEHPGAVFYQEASLLLPEAATDEEVRTRAHLIAHETAHMWFGDLVTMPWFDDVWLKEVFANLMAEKILAGRDTDARARLRLYVSHYPAAYDVDRTDGAHPIRQPLDNLARASELYGPIAYQKSPIAFRNLERRMGEGPFRAAVRDYLHRHAWSCAGWPELLAICERVHGRALGAWSRQWIEMAGRPDIVLSADWAAEDYGHVVLDPPGARVLLDSIGADDGHAGGPDAAHRAASWMALWDAVCDGALPPGRFATALLERVPREGEPLLRDWLTTLLRRVFWRWLTDDERRGLAPEVEQMCRTALASSRDPVERRAWLGRLRGLTSSPAGTDWLHSVWLARRCQDDGLDPHDEIALAETLCVLDDARASEVLAVQSDRLVDAAARARLDYLAPALRSGVAGHSAVVAGFAAPGRRHPEAWTLDALTWIHHPLRRRDAARLIEPCLQLLPEVQAAGDIFVPRRWAHAVLQGYSGADAVDAVERALALDTLTAFHRRLVLEAADDLLRVTRRGRYARAGGAAGAVVNDEGSGA